MDFLENLWVGLMAFFAIVIVAAIAIFLFSAAITFAYDQSHCESYEHCMYPDAT